MTSNQDFFLRPFPGYGPMGPSKKQGCRENGDEQDQDNMSKPGSSELVLLFSFRSVQVRG